MTIAVSRKQISALFGWHLGQSGRAARHRMTSVPGPSRTRIPRPGPGLQSLVLAASAVVPFAADVFPRTFTRINVGRGAQRLERLRRTRMACRSAGGRLEPRVRLETEPGEIVQKRCLVLGAASDAIMVFDAKQDATAEGTRDTPDVDRVDDVSEVEITGRRGREAGEGRRAEGSLQPCEIRTMQESRNA